ncbi:protein kinase [Candidatus Zixiibacteriota bacterium]
MVGKTVGHYQIEEKIGEGGMGVVYRADDTKLKRTVALKFLPPDATRSAEARERFIHEAQAASALDHPNICTIYEIDETDEGQIFIVMGLYEGQTLREKIAERPLKLDDAIDITTQIAQGLAKAHEQKIIHRDIKPANIFITSEGQVKILDFGVAKLAGSTKLTLTGTTLGTVSYMAPEQAKGDEADHKADTWSLGVLLYEMLTGQQPFKGEHEQAIIYSILNEEPEPITALRTGVPIDLEWIVQKALKKDPRQRYQHIDEIPVDLESVEERRINASRFSAVTLPSAEVDTQQDVERASPLGMIGVVAIVALIAGGLLATLFTSELGTPAKPLQRFEIQLPGLDMIGSGSRVEVSHDGKNLVFQADDYSFEGQAERQLYIRSLDDLTVYPLPDTWTPVYPTFSPDSEWLGFLDYSNWTLKRHSLESGRTISICEVGGNIWGMDWGADDEIIYAQRTPRKLMLVSAFGGSPREVVIADSIDENISFRWPQFLPGGKEVLLTLWRNDLGTFNSAQIAALSLKTGELKTLITERAAFAQYLPEIHHLVYIKDGTLTAAPFNLRKLEITGNEIATSETIQIENIGGRFSISRDGLLVYVPSSIGNTPTEDVLFYVEPTGVFKQLEIEPRNFDVIKVSPDGTRLAAEIDPGEASGGHYDIWIYNLESNGSFKLTYEGINWSPVWTPNSEHVTFSSNRAGNYDIYIKNADGSGEAELIISSDLQEHPISWSADGKTLAYYTTGSETGYDIWIYNSDDGSINPILNTPFAERTPMFSPDGQWIAYCSTETGHSEVFVQPAPGTQRAGKWQISDGVGTEPLWDPNGNGIYYRSNNKVMLVEVDFEPTFTKSTPVILFEGQYHKNAAQYGYDIHPNGTQFIMAKRATDTGAVASTINVVTNVFKEINRLQGGREQ